jgi:excisionase family DNA binding protein
MNEHRLLNVYEVARYLGVSTKTVYRLVSRGELKAVTVGRLWRFRPEDVERFVAWAGTK